MKPLKLVVIFALVVVFIVGGISIGIASATQPLTLEPEPATLEIESQGVEVKTVGSTDWMDADDGMELSAGDSLRTDATGLAAVNLFDQGVIRLDVNTEITLEEALWDASNPTEFSGSVFVETGRLWSRLFDFVSPSSSYNVETSSTVATVRGTIFSVTAFANGDAWVYVDDHTVNVRSGLAITDVQEGEHAEVTRNESDRFDIMKHAVASTDLKTWIERNREKDRQFEANVRARLRKQVGTEGNFTRFAQRVRVALAGDLTKQELRERFQLRHKLLERTESPNEPSVSASDEPMKMNNDTGADMEMETTTTMEIMIEKPITAPIIETPEPEEEPTPEPVAEPVEEPVEEPVVEPVAEEPEAYPVDLVVTASNYTVTAGGSITLNADLIYSDDTTVDVTREVNWDLYPDPQTNEVNGNIVVDTYFAGNTAGTAPIVATYIVGQTRYSADMQITITNPPGYTYPNY